MTNKITEHQEEVIVDFRKECEVLGVQKWDGNMWSLASLAERKMSQALNSQLEIIREQVGNLETVEGSITDGFKTVVLFLLKADTQDTKEKI